MIDIHDAELMTLPLLLLNSEIDIGYVFISSTNMLEGFK